MGHLRRWHLSHAIVTHAKTMQVCCSPSRPFSDHQLALTTSIEVAASDSLLPHPGAALCACTDRKLSFCVCVCVCVCVADLDVPCGSACDRGSTCAD